MFASRNVFSWIFFGALFFFASFSYASAEVIHEFDATIDVQRDGVFSVTEKITYDFGFEERHGIFRFIPTDHPQDASAWYLTRYTDIEVHEVLRDGSPEPHTVTKGDDRIHIKIGDPQKTISGEHVYEIHYTVRGGLSYFRTRSEAELYWNVTGTEWDAPILKAEARLVGDESLFLAERSCYRGYEHGVGSCVISKSSGEPVVFSANELAPGKGMTIAQSLDGSMVEKLVLERAKKLLLFGMALGIWFVILSVFVYRYRTKYRVDRPVIAQYEPYEDFKPMFTGLLFDGRLDPHDITAGIVYLAEQGYLKIEKIDRKVLFFFSVDDYTLTLRKSIDELKSPFLRDVLTLLFGSNSAPGSSVTLSDLKSDTSKQRKNQEILKDLKKDLEDELKEKGFFEVNVPKRYIVALFIALVAGTMFLGSFLFSLVSELLRTQAETFVPFVFILLVGSAVILAFMYRRRTRKGYEALNHLEGFKQFLSVTDKERFEFHNAPAKSPQQFMEYLPYAIAFGVEKQWAEVFKDVTIPDPEWYSGGATGAHFSATNFATSIGAFSSAFASSSGSSASSGGGSVGGGAGGGGGGSW